MINFGIKKNLNLDFIRVEIFLFKSVFKAINLLPKTENGNTCLIFFGDTKV